MGELQSIVGRAMEALAVRRPVFHSEADFQLALAWELQTSHPSADLRLEKRVIDDPRVELDILFVLDGVRLGLELKYPRSGIAIEVAGERFVLRTGAPDLDRYDVLRDVSRLERLVAEDVVDEGYGVVVTNVAGLWRAPKQSAQLASYDAFRIHEDREITGTLDWGPTAGEGTKTGRLHPIAIVGRYTCTWRDFSEVGGVRFRYLLLPVLAPPGPPAPPELLA